MREYKELIKNCKQAYKNNDLKLAYNYWCEIFDITFKKLDELDDFDDKNRFKVWKKHNKVMEKFTNDEVYRITDYGKRQAYYC